jgi:hypothetical protein
MKTAMQQFLEWLENSSNVKDDILNWELVKENALEKEKEQIMNDYKEGVNKGILYCNGEVFISKEEYYNQTYNQNK